MLLEVVQHLAETKQEFTWFFPLFPNLCLTVYSPREYNCCFLAGYCSACAAWVLGVPQVSSAIAASQQHSNEQCHSCSLAESFLFMVF